MSVAALDLLTFIALSSGVHADAVQCQVDDTRRAIVHMSSDEETLVEMETQLRALLKKQAKLHKLQGAIAQSQAQRHGGDSTHRARPPASARRSRASESPGAQRMGIRQLTRSEATAATDTLESSFASSVHVEGMRTADVLRLASRAVAAEDVSAPSAAGATRSTAAEVEVIDAETDTLKEALRQLETHSLKSKLLRLEAHKKATAAVDARQILREHVTPFCFSPAVEQLWGATSGVAPAQAHADASPPSKSGTVRRRSVAAAAAAVVEGQAPVMTAASLPGVVRRACQRLVGRYADALDAIGSTDLSDASAAEQVLDCLLYACALDPERDEVCALADDAETSTTPEALTTVREVDTVMDLDDFVRHIGETGTPAGTTFGPVAVDYDQRRFSTASGQTKCTGVCVSDPAGSGSPTSVLSAQEFCALPVDWPSTLALVDVPVTALLAPARHLLTPRFSFADANEMKCLDALRLRLQRAIVRTAVDLETVCQGIADVAPQHVGPRDLAVLTARLEAARNPRNMDDSRQWIRWRTLVKDAAP